MAGKQFRSAVLAGLALVGAGGSAAAQRTERSSVDSSGAQATGASSSVSLSADGRFVVFTSDAANLVANDRNLSSDLFVRDRLTGVTSLVSTDANGNQADDASFTFSREAISDDGRFVGFTSDASNLVPGTLSRGDRVYVKDLQTGAIDLVSVDSAGNEADLTSDLDAISADGRFVVFDSPATNLVAGDTNGAVDVFVRDRRDRAGERRFERGGRATTTRSVRASPRTACASRSRESPTTSSPATATGGPTSSCATGRRGSPNGSESTRPAATRTPRVLTA
jgi:Tol biopolymer transport system component